MVSTANAVHKIFRHRFGPLSPSETCSEPQNGHAFGTAASASSLPSGASTAIAAA